MRRGKIAAAQKQKLNGEKVCVGLGGKGIRRGGKHGENGLKVLLADINEK